MRAEPSLHLDDFTIGDTVVSDPYDVSRDEILAYATEFDPQPFHLHEGAGSHSLLAGLAASGWHVCAIGMRLVFDTFLHRTASLGAPGIETVRWILPVHPGDRLTLNGQVTAVRASRSKPDRGFVTFAFTLLNQDGAAVMSQANSIIVRRNSCEAER